MAGAKGAGRVDMTRLGRRIYKFSSAAVAIVDLASARNVRQARTRTDRCCSMYILASWADSGISLQVQADYAATMEADVQTTLNLEISLRRRMTA